MFVNLLIVYCALDQLINNEIDNKLLLLARGDNRYCSYLTFSFSNITMLRFLRFSPTWRLTTGRITSGRRLKPTLFFLFHFPFLFYVFFFILFFLYYFFLFCLFFFFFFFFFCIFLFFFTLFIFFFSYSFVISSIFYRLHDCKLSLRGKIDDISFPIYFKGFVRRTFFFYFFFFAFYLHH